MRLGDRVVHKESGFVGVVVNINHPGSNAPIATILDEGKFPAPHKTAKFNLKDLNRIDWGNPSKIYGPKAEDYMFTEEELAFNVEDAVKYEVRPIRMQSKILTTIKRFVLIRDIENSASGADSIHKEGDVLEEAFDSPNEFWNMSLAERRNSNRAYRTTVQRINDNNTEPESLWFNALVPMEDIDTKESEYFRKRTKKAASLYKNKMRKFALLNEEITNLKHLLDIKEEENE